MKSIIRIVSILAVISLLILQCSLLSAHAAQVDTPVEEKFEKGNEAYSSGNYEQAISEYETIIDEHGFSAEVLYNLGNSYAQKGQSGFAILHYLRGLQLAPEDSDIKGNLELTRKNIGLFEEIPTTATRFFNLFDMNQWALVALLSYIFTTSLFVINIRFPLKRGVKTGTILLLLVIITVSLVGVLRQRGLWNSAVIITPETRLLMSPFESASPLGTIQEGSLVIGEKSHGNYQYINDLKGRSGWIPATSLELLNNR